MGDVIGGRPRGYMHGGAMEVGALWGMMSSGWGRGDIFMGGAMEVGVLWGMSSGGGLGDICMGVPWK